MRSNTCNYTYTSYTQVTLVAKWKGNVKNIHLDTTIKLVGCSTNTRHLMIDNSNVSKSSSHNNNNSNSSRSDSNMRSSSSIEKYDDVSYLCDII